jgi:hypothetical protein
MKYEILAFLSVILCIAIVLGGAYAWFGAALDEGLVPHFSQINGFNDKSVDFLNKEYHLNLPYDVSFIEGSTENGSVAGIGIGRPDPLLNIKIAIPKEKSENIVDMEQWNYNENNFSVYWAKTASGAVNYIEFSKEETDGTRAVHLRLFCSEQDLYNFKTKEVYTYEITVAMIISGTVILEALSILLAVKMYKKSKLQEQGTPAD